MRNSLMALLALMFAGQVQQIPQSTEQWSFYKSWVFIVDVDPQDTLFQKTSSIQQLLDLFQKKGTRKERILYFRDTLAQAEGLKVAFKNFIKKIPKDEFLFFYYSGSAHFGTKNEPFFSTYDSSGIMPWKVGDIIQSLQVNFKGKNAFLLADGKNAGVLADVAQKVNAFKYIVFTASAPNHVEPGYSVFNQVVLSVLSGEPYADFNDDHKITLSEMARYIEREMATSARQKSWHYIPSKLLHFVVAPASVKTSAWIAKQVKVTDKKNTYLGMVLSEKGNQVQVQYYHPSKPTEWIEKTRIKPWNPVTYPITSTVKVKSPQGKIRTGRVLKVTSGMHYIKYYGYSDDQNEWIWAEDISE